MTIFKPDEEVRDFLNTRLTDPISATRTANTTYVCSNWPYLDGFRTTDFPKISIVKQTSDNTPFSMGSGNLYQNVKLLLTIFIKPDIVYTIGGSPYEGFNLARRLEDEIEEAFKIYAISDLLTGGKFIVFSGLNSDSAMRNFEYNLVQQNMYISLERLNI